MKTMFAIAAVSSAAVLAGVAPASAAQSASAPTAMAQKSGMDFMGRSVDYAAAAKAEGLAAPTKNFTLSARFGQAGPYWSSGFHGGLDFAAPMGTTIMAADAGRVVTAGPGGAYGNMIEIAHGDGTRTLYAHLSDIDVKVGQRVARGEHIGDLGSTGNSTGPHLHFEVLRNGDQVDPEKYLNL